MHLGRNKQNDMAKFGRQTKVLDTSNLPESIDWRELGGVNAIQNQGSCGSCWAFSSVVSMEGAHFVATGTLEKFSEQQLVDCAYITYGNFGCNGGLEDNAFKYYESNGAMYESDYSYQGTKGSCSYSTRQATDVQASTYLDVTVNSESQVKAAIAQQPISVAIQANQMVFQLYTSGIFDNTRCGTNLDHAVALVGYGSEGGQDYYILRNSWGTTWGESGYMRIADNGDGAGICGVQSAAVYPTTN